MTRKLNVPPRAGEDLLDAYRAAYLMDLGEVDEDSLEADDIRLQIFRTTPFLHQGVKS